MKLHDVTPDQMPGDSRTHVGTAEPDEVARLLTDTSAVLREAGLDVGQDAPDSIVVVPLKGGGAIIVIIEDGLLVATIVRKPITVQ
jgi:hypothetical protein